MELDSHRTRDRNGRREGYRGSVGGRWVDIRRLSQNVPPASCDRKTKKNKDSIFLREVQSEVTTTVTIFTQALYMYDDP